MREHSVLHPNYEKFRTQLEGTIRDFSLKGEWVAKGDRNDLKKFIHEGIIFNVKKFKKPNIFQSLVYRFIRKGKARRSFEYALKLNSLGINTPTPVGYYENFEIGLKESFYVCLYLDFDFDFRVLNHNPNFPDRPKILRQMAAFTYKMHQNNVNFLDHSPGNSLIINNGNGEYDFYLIDLNRMRFETMDFKKRMRNFRRLWLSKTMINIMAQEYATLCGKPFDLVHGQIAKYSRQFQKKVNLKKLRRSRGF